MADDETLGPFIPDEGEPEPEADTLAEASPFADQGASTAAGPRHGGAASEQATASVPRDAQPTRDASAGDADSDLSERIEAALDRSERPFVQGDPLLGRTIANRFVIESKIGAGGMGAVYRASQLGMDRHVAIKVLLNELTQNPMIIKRFHMEALAVSKLQHPNTIRIFDFGQTADGVLFIAMEFLQGRSLEHELRQHKVIAVRRALRILAQTCRSLEEAHDKGIVHRDLKPDNIFLLRVGSDPDFVKVLDFGVAKLKAEDNRMGTLTQAGMVFGTPKYMSPEQSRSDLTDARADVYALGIILYEMVAGRAPFEADNPLSLLIQHVQDEVPPPSSMRPDLVVPAVTEEIILRCLEKEPDKRFQSARELAEALEAARSELDEAFEEIITRERAESLGLRVRVSAARRRDEAFTAQSPRLDRAAQEDATAPLSPEDAAPLLAALRRRRRRRRALGAVAALVVALGAAGGALYANLPGTPEGFPRLFAPQALTIGEPEALALEMVTVEVNSEPPGATVFREDRPIGRTPLAIERQRRPESERLELQKDGYRSAVLEVNYGLDGAFSASLEEHKPTVITVTRESPPAAKPTGAGRDQTTGAEPRKPLSFQGGKVDDIK